MKTKLDFIFVFEDFGTMFAFLYFGQLESMNPLPVSM